MPRFRLEDVIAGWPTSIGEAINLPPLPEELRFLTPAEISVPLPHKAVTTFMRDGFMNVVILYRGKLYRQIRK